MLKGSIFGRGFDSRRLHQNIIQQSLTRSITPSPEKDFGVSCFQYVPIKSLDIPSLMTVFITVHSKGLKGDTVMPLKDTTIRNAKPKKKQYKLSDEKSLYLLTKKAGKYFRFDYRYAGKRKTLALGVYPNVRLAKARE